MKKGCLIALGGVAAVILLAIGGCIFLAKHYEHEHPELAAGLKALTAAEVTLISRGTEIAQGNDERARALAKQFAQAMKMGRMAFFTDPESDKKTLSDGQFVTYCSLLPDRCAFVVHVPQLRNYSPEAKVEMAEMAWRMAVGVLQDQKIEVKEVAIGIRGLMDFGPILVGTPPSGGVRCLASKTARMKPVRKSSIPFLPQTPLRPNRRSRQSARLRIGECGAEPQRFAGLHGFHSQPGACRGAPSHSGFPLGSVRVRSCSQARWFR